MLPGGITQHPEMVTLDSGLPSLDELSTVVVNKKEVRIMVINFSTIMVSMAIYSASK